MKTLVVISDTHGSKKGISDLLPVIRENDFVLHLGDGFTEFGALLGANPSGFYYCAGNCDSWGDCPQEGVLEVEDVKIFYCHGHAYGVKTGLNRLAARAKAQGCSVALYGHTHTPRIDEIDGVMLGCPGSIQNPKDKGGCYAYLVVHGAKTTATLVGENPR